MKTATEFAAFAKTITVVETGRILQGFPKLPNPIISDGRYYFNEGGPVLGCVACKEDVTTQYGTNARLYRKHGIDGPFRTLDCPSCLEELVNYAE